MKKTYKDALNETRISDDKLKRLIMEVFEQKFSYLSKKDYLRWINERTISERLKSLTVDWMSSEDINEHPRWAGYYNSNNFIRIKENGYFPKKTLEHEANHFLNSVVKQFPRYINEGITEFLTIRSLEFNETKFGQDQISYGQNVHLVELLYNIFGDELIKCYLAGVSDDFETKMSKYFNGKLHLFYDLIEKIHDVEYSDDSVKNPTKFKQNKDNLYKTKFTDFKEFLVTLVENSIKEDMLDFKFYSNSKIDFASMHKLISDRIGLIQKIVSLNDIENLYKRMYLSALSNSYLIKYCNETELKEKINNYFSFDGRTLTIKNTGLSEELDSQTYGNDNMYYAAEMRLKTHNYYANGGFDISAFLLDYYTLINNGKYEKTPNEKMQLLHSLLVNTLKSEVNMDIINNIIAKYGELFSNMASVRTENRKTVSDSLFYDVTQYKNGPKKYIEKRDNEFYFISYDSNERQFSRKGMGFWKYSYNRDFPKAVSYIERLKSNSKEYRILFDENFEKALFDGKILTPIELLNDVVTEELKNSIDYDRYMIKYANGDSALEIEGQSYIPDAHTRGRYIFDFEALFNDLSSIRFLKKDVITNVTHKIIDEALNKTFQLRTIPENIKNTLYKNAYNSITSGKYVSKEEIERCLLNLCNLEKEYIESQPHTGAIYFKNEDERKKFKDTLQKKENEIEKMKIRNEWQDKSMKLVNGNYEEFIVERYDERLSSEQFNFGIKNLEFTTKVDYQSPIARKINFDLLITALRQIYNNLSADEKKMFVKFYNFVDYLVDKLFGDINMSGDYGLQLKKDTIKSLLGEIVSNNDEYDISTLNNISDEIISLFDKTRDMAKKILMERQVKSPQYRQIYKKILEIYDDKNLSEEEKMNKIDLLVSVLNQPEENEELKYIDELINHHRRNAEKNINR